MIKTKKIVISIILCSVMLLSCFAVAFAAQTRGAVESCPKCGDSIRIFTSYSMVSTYRSPCKHYSAGYDLYGIFQYVDEGICPGCGYHYYEPFGEKDYSSTVYRCEGTGVAL